MTAAPRGMDSPFRSRGRLPDRRGAGAFAQSGEIVYIAPGFIAAFTGRKQGAATFAESALH